MPALTQWMEPGAHSLLAQLLSPRGFPFGGTRWPGSWEAPLSVSVWVGEACSRARNLETETSCSPPRWQFTHTLVGSTGLEVGFQLPFAPSGANMHTICSAQGSRGADALQLARGDRPGRVLPSDPSKAQPGASGTRGRSSEASARDSDSQRLVVPPRGATCPENSWPRPTRPSPQH